MNADRKGPQMNTDSYRSDKDKSDKYRSEKYRSAHSLSILICGNPCSSVAVLSACIRVIRGLDFHALVLCLFVAWTMSGCARPAHSRPPAAALVSAAGVDAAEPAVVTSSDGSIYVAWVEHLDGTLAVWQRGQGTEANVVTTSIDSKGVIPSSLTEELNSQLPAAAMIGDRIALAAVHQTADDRRSIWFVVRPAFLEPSPGDTANCSQRVCF